LSLPDSSAELSEKSHNPGHATPAGLTRDWFGLFRFRSPLLTESRLLSLPVGIEMFHFPTFPPHALCVQAWVTGHDSSRVSPFGNPRITARLAAPRGLSQPPTSFIGSWCQGIHRAPLLAWPQRCSRPLCSSQGAGGPGPSTYDSDRASPQQSAEPVALLSQNGRPALSWAERNGCPFPQDPTTCPFECPRGRRRSIPKDVLNRRCDGTKRIVSVPPMSWTAGRSPAAGAP
jgi:hypothetical protein